MELHLIIAELIFLILISGSSLHWYHGMMLMGVYVVYIVYMFATMKKSERDEAMLGRHHDEEDSMFSNTMKNLKVLS